VLEEKKFFINKKLSFVIGGKLLPLGDERSLVNYKFCIKRKEIMDIKKILHKC